MERKVGDTEISFMWVSLVLAGIFVVLAIATKMAGITLFTTLCIILSLVFMAGAIVAFNVGFCRYLLAVSHEEESK